MAAKGSTENSSDAVERNMGPRAYCAKHGGRQIEYLCRSHQEVACSDCMVLEHRSCTDVARLLDVCTESSTGDEIGEFKKQLCELVDNITCQIGVSDSYATHALNDSDKAMNDVDSFVEDVCEIVKYLGKEAKDQISIQKEENISRLKKLGSKAKLLKDDVEAMATTARELETSNNTTEMVILMKQEKKSLKVWEKVSKAISDQTVLQQVIFKPDAQVSKYVRGATKIGRLEKGIQYKPNVVLTNAMDINREVSANQPFGEEMKVKELTDTTEISFTFIAGTQERSHPKPGTSYDAATFKCILRRDGKGSIIRDQLRRVFDNRLLFTVGDNNRIVCNVELFDGWVYGWFFILTSEYLQYEKRVLEQLSVLGERTGLVESRRR